MPSAYNNDAWEHTTRHFIFFLTYKPMPLYIYIYIVTYKEIFFHFNKKKKAYFKRFLNEFFNESL